MFKRDSLTFELELPVKGIRAYVEGKIVSRSYTNGDGEKKYITEIMADVVINLESRKKQEEPADEGIDPEEMV